jgi:hypothetical protein
MRRAECAACGIVNDTGRTLCDAIEDLLTHPDTRYLLLIGAYRDNEVDASHPLVTTLETIRHSGAPVDQPTSGTHAKD